MNINIYLPPELLLSLVFVAGLLIGCFYHNKIKGFANVVNVTRPPASKRSNVKPPKPTHNPNI